MPMSSKNQNLRVGFFVLSLMALLGAMLFLVSGSTKLLEERYSLNAYWKDIGGLKEGAIVRLAGLDVGEVISVKFAEGEERRLHVQLSIERKYEHRIRQCTEEQAVQEDERAPQRISSEARIDTVGVLGDKYVSLSMGDPACSQMAEGDWINTQEAIDIVAYTKTATEIMGRLNSIGSKIDDILGSDEEAGRASLSRSFQNLEDITVAVKEGDGLIHALLYDKEMRRKVDDAARKADETAENLRAASKGITDAVSMVQEGDGLAHQLIYGQDGSRLADELRVLSTAMTSLVGDIKNEDSLLSALIYDSSKKQVLEDLVATASSLRSTAESLETGDGTVALLMRDPTLYEDLRALVGGAQRNKLLRAYIRRTVEESERTDASGWGEEQ
jgi:phospholipid/cholesterol/gamma-HCH transport system substrate-binding protein